MPVRDFCIYMNLLSLNIESVELWVVSAITKSLLDTKELVVLSYTL